MGVSGVGLYYVILQIILSYNDLSLSAYKGADSAFQISISQLPQLILRTFQNIISFFKGEHFWHINLPFITIIYTIPVILSVAMIIIVLFHKKANPVQWVYAGFCLIIFPFCCDIIDLIVSTTEASPLNVYALVCFWLLPIILRSNLKEELTFINIRLQNIAELSLTVCLALLIWGNILHCNQYYLKANKTYEATAALTNRVFARLEALPEYSAGYPIVFIGDSSSTLYDMMYNNYPDIITPQGLNQKSEIISYNADISTTYKVAQWIENLLGVKINYIDDYDAISEIINSEEYMEMGAWPEESGIAIINDTIVVNFVRFRSDSLEISIDSMTVTIVNTYIPLDSTQTWLYRFQVLDADNDNTLVFSTSYIENNNFTYEFESSGNYVIKVIMKNENGYSMYTESELITVTE